MNIQTSPIFAFIAGIILYNTPLSEAALVDDLVEYWAFDGDLDAGLDDSNDGTLSVTGAASGTFVTGKFGSAVDLENSAGNQAIIQVGDPGEFAFAGGSMTVSAWYTTQSLYTGWNALVSQGEGSNWRLARHGSSTTNFKWAASGPGSVNAELDQQDGSWHHVAVTHDAINGVTMYIDGVAAGTAAAWTLGASSNIMQIGGNAGAANRGWDGNIDDVALWSRALTQTEVESIWAGGTGASIASIITTTPPTVVNSGATNIVPTSATIGGEVTENAGSSPTVTLYWGDNDGGTTPGNWDNSIPLGGQTGIFSSGITGLTPATTYYFRAFASNGAGDDWANSTANFSTGAPPNPPTIVNNAASSVDFTNATLNGTVTNTGGETPNVTIYYGDNDGGTNTGSWDNFVTVGAQSGAYSSELINLTSNTTYFFRALAQNSGGTSWAPSTENLTTLAYSLATLTNSAATNITGTAAQVSGDVTSTGGDIPTITIYYGDNDGGTTPGNWDDSISLGLKGADFSTALSGLSQLTTYFYRASAQNAAGISWASSSLSFTTLEVSELVINEFMAANDGGMANNANSWYPIANQVPGTSEDWIEILNTGSTTLDLGGWRLTDNAGDLAKWTFPPGTNLGSGQFLIVYASNDNAPDANGNLHTNFKLSGGGEYLALVRPSGTIASEFGPGGSDYPSQEDDISYGLHPVTGESVFFQNPTPGSANDPGGVLLVADTNFSHKRGYYTSAFDVTISTDTPGSTIRYTTDGTLPTLSNGSTYSTPISITTTTVLRTRAYKTGQQETDVDTQSYIFPVDVASQTKPAGYPNNWGNNDYEVDTSISQSGTYSARFQTGLRSVPTVSLVGNPLDFFGPSGIWVNTGNRNLEAPVSAEYFQPDPLTDGVNTLSGFQIDCGAKLQGGASRNPGSAVKHSMSMRFRDTYGEGKLNFPVFEDNNVTTFDSLHLRAMYNNSWVHSSSGQRARATMIRDQWARSSMIDMGNLDGGHGHYAHVYINGLYWGLYNLHERLENDHYAAHNGYEDDEVLGRNPGSATSEENASYNQMIGVATSNSSTWTQIKAVIDVENYIDYVITEYFGRNADLKSNDNWRCAGGGTANAPWRFYCWDTERIFESETNTNPPSNSGQFDGALIFDDLRDYREFRVLFADRAYKHLFNNGALNNLNSRARFEKLATLIDTAIIGESARWGDDRGTTYTRDNHWTKAVYGTPGGPGTSPSNGVLGSWFPLTGTTRTDRIITNWQSRTFSGHSDTYLGTIDAPLFIVNGSSQHGGEVPTGGSVSATATSGNIYYTTDGTDPRLEGGGLAAGATLLNTNINPGSSGLVRARARVGSGDSWSPLTEASFYLEQLAAPGDLVIAEIHYNPYSATATENATGSGLAIPRTFDNADDFEFIEVHNISGNTLNLDGVSFSAGIDFTFGLITLAPGGRAVVVKDVEAFGTRYPSVTPAGTFTGNLNNGGEQIALESAAGAPIFAFTYDNGGQWPGRADGNGSSLELVSSAGSFTDPDNWRSSSEFNGSPGAAGAGPDGRILINEVLSHSDLPQTDSIEIYNTTGSAISIGGWVISDDNSAYSSFSLPAATIGAGQYLSYNESDFNAAPANPVTSYSGTLAAAPTTVTDNSHGLSTGDTITIEGYGGTGTYNDTWQVTVTGTNTFTIDTAFLDNHSTKGSWAEGRPFGLSAAEGETLWLLETDGSGNPIRFVDAVNFAAAFNSEALGRWPNGAGTGTLVSMTSNTLGFENLGAQVGPVVISEVMYHPNQPAEDFFEYVEICNTGSVTENLANWKLRGGADFNFTASHNLAPGEGLVIVAFDPAANTAAAAAFRSEYGIDSTIPLVGPYTDGPLDNVSGTVRLQRPDTPPASDPTFYPQVTEDEVIYESSAPWPTAAGGTGKSLDRLPGFLFGNFATSWTANDPTPGGHTTNYDSWAESVFGPGNPPNSGETEDFDGDSIPNLIEFALGMNPLVNGPELAPEFVVEGPNATMTFNKNLLVSGLTYTVQSSPDLVNWTPVPDSQISVSNFVEIRKASVALPATGGFYLRLVVTD